MHARICVHTTRTQQVSTRRHSSRFFERARDRFSLRSLINHECTRGLTECATATIHFHSSSTFFPFHRRWIFGGSLTEERVENQERRERTSRKNVVDDAHTTTTTTTIINNFFFLFPSTWLRHLYLNRIYVGARVSLLSAHDRETTPWTFWFACGGEALGSPPRRNINLVHLPDERNCIP